MAEAPGSFPIDVAVGPEEIIVYAELPGTQIGDLQLSARGTQLTIRARPSPRAALESGARWMARERRVGALRRTIALPYAVDLERASLVQTRGVLEIRLKPKASVVEREGLGVLERPSSPSRPRPAAPAKRPTVRRRRAPKPAAPPAEVSTPEDEAAASAAQVEEPTAEVPTPAAPTAESPTAEEPTHEEQSETDTSRGFLQSENA